MINKDETIKLKLKKAEAFMSEVETLVEKKFYNTAINRLYYSCFHVTKAFLVTKELTAKTHSGVSILLQKLVQKNLFDSFHASFFAKLMNERIDDDYSDFMIMNDEEVIGFIKPGKQYLEYLTQLINEYFDAQRTTSTSE